MSVFSSQEASQVAEESETRTFGHMRLKDGREGGMGKGYRDETERKRNTLGKVKVTVRWQMV